MSEEVAACPACDSASIEVAGVGGMEARATHDTTPYRCQDCAHRFDTPDYREAKSHRNSQNGIARVLADADPGEWPA